MTTSFTSGWPRREICLYLPLAFFRSVVLQMPTTDWPFLVRSPRGTCRATLLTLKPARLSWPASVMQSPPYSTSNTRRSRKNGSSAWPANDLRLPL